jgi:hypothetical protein
MNTPKDFYLKKFDLLAQVQDALEVARLLMGQLQDHEGTAPCGDCEDLDFVSQEIHDAALSVSDLKDAISPMVEMHEPPRMSASQIHEAMGSSLSI